MVHRFRHEALFHAGEEELLAHVVPYVREGIANAEPVLAVLGSDRAQALRSALGTDAERIDIVDLGTVGRNPARLLPVWRRFVDRHPGEVPLRGLTEPLVATRRADALEECAIHEQLLDLAFGDAARPFTLVCAYDVTSLATVTLGDGTPALIRARDGHAVHWDAGRRSTIARPATPFSWPDAATLDEPTTVAVSMSFDVHSSLADVRAAVGEAATRAGFDTIDCEEIVLVVHEMMTNTLRHGGGRGTLRAWVDDDEFVCEVCDDGRIPDPLVGRRQPAPHAPDGRGLWIANQLCDLVQIRRRGDGLVVRARHGRSARPEVSRSRRTSSRRGSRRSPR